MTSLNSAVIELLGRPNMLGEDRALAARMIVADGEINHILARTKGILARPIWAGCAHESDRCNDLFVAEWERFKSRVADDTEFRRHPSPSERDVFKEAVAGTEYALARLRQEFAQLGKTSWVYDDEEP
ncbi:hypothetical protein [Catenulispora acidiphila]|uniref:hypothetical protein n=1 Tax=Catenulispora acidiphila TaxID=304895 RepID=UPI00019DF70F|nr:hypothetical protein [Catenulispora acidiphila]